MSAPGLIALVGNLLATVAILPHLAQAIRERRPTGSAYGWALGAATAALWLAYGWTTHTPEIGAPGYVTFPVSVTLGVWAWRHARAADREIVDLTLAGTETGAEGSVTRTDSLVTAA